MTQIWRDILEDFDFWLSDGCAYKDRSILVVDSLQFLEGSIFSGTSVIPHGISTACVVNDFLRFRLDEASDDCKLIWDVSRCQPIPDTKYVLKGVNVFPANPEIDFEVDAQTVLLPLLQDSCLPVRVIELFSGACGGWKTALNFVTQQTGVEFSTLAVDHDLNAAFAYAVSFAVPLVSGNSHVNPALASMHANLVVQADVAGDSWLELASAWKPDLVTISAPCQPWSSAGSASGLYSDMGQVLFKALSACKLLRPRVIALEQVSAFMSHEHYRLLVQTLRWAGYNLHHSHVLEASEILPIARARWLAIALRVDDPVVIPCPFKGWTSGGQAVPNTWNAILPHDMLDDARIRPDSYVLAISARHDLLPPAKRRMITKANVLASRCFTGAEKLPTLVASYGSQHKFSMAWLSEKGLMNHFAMGHDGKPRYWHPFELWLLHGGFGSHFVLRDWEIAYRHLGNQICPLHALVTLANALNCLQKFPETLDAASLVTKFVEQRATVDTMRVEDLQVGHLISGLQLDLTGGQKRSIMDFHLGLVNGQLPEGLIWTFDGFSQPQAPSHDVVDTFPATVPFETFESMQICCAGQTFSFSVQTCIAKEQVLKFWEDAFVFLSLDCDPDGLPTLVPNDKPALHHESCTEVALVITKQGLHLVRPDSPVLEWLCSQCQGSLIDIQGYAQLKMNPHDVLFTCGFGLEKVNSYCHSVSKYLLACQQCNIHVTENFAGLSLQVTVEGPLVHAMIVVGFWQVILKPADLVLLGYECQIQCNHKNAKVVFLPTVNACPVPVGVLQFVLASRAFHALLLKLHDEQGIPVKLKHLANQTWRGKLPVGLTIASLKQLLHSVTWIKFGASHFRVIAKSRQWADESKLADLAVQDGSFLTVHFVLQLKGGGSFENGTKSGHKTQIKNALAGVFLDEGHDLSWTSKTVEEVMDKVGVKELSKILHHTGPAKLKAAGDFVQRCGLEIPKVNAGRASQSAANAKRKKQVTMPNPDNYKAIEGVLMNENGTPAMHLVKFGGHLNGYHLCTPQAAIPWLRQGEQLSKDELGLLVFGDLPIPTQLKHEHVTIPCLDERGRNVLVAGVLVQCGEKQIQVKKGDGHKIATDGSILVAVTWWKHDWPESWDDICSNPYKCLRSFPGAEEILLSVWGKSYRSGKMQTTPSAASSVQVHCLIKEDALAPFLKLSGFNLLWLTPKTKEGKPHPDWKMLWLDGSIDLQSATVTAAKLADSAGLVRQNGRFAIRIPKTAFEEAWKLVYPQIEPPKDVDTSRIFKLESLPYGVSNKMLLEWASHNNWDMKPLRAVGPRAWMVGSGGDPPAAPLHFNGAPMLVRELQGKFHPASHPIVAGPGPTPAKFQGFPGASNAQLIGDPWASYIGPKVQPQVAPASALPNAAAMGPTEQKFTQQADRLTKLEAAVQQLQTGQAKQHESIEEIKQTGLERDKAIRAHMDDQLKSIKTDLSQSFAIALQQQTAQFQNNLEEIKGLLRSKPKRKDRAAEDADMSGS